jgi:hypothetical protein
MRPRLKAHRQSPASANSAMPGMLWHACYHAWSVALWVRSLPPDPEGYARFEFGNTVQLPITEEAMVAESKTLW